MSGANSKQLQGIYFCIKTLPKIEKPRGKKRKEQREIEQAAEKSIAILTGKELQNLLDVIAKVPLIDRFRGTADERLIAFKGDSLLTDGKPLPFPLWDGGDFTCAIFMKKRTINLPAQATEKDGEIEIAEIRLGDDTYIMETTYVLLHKKTGIMLLLNNRNVGTSGAFAYYLSQFDRAGNPEYFETCPIANIDAFERLNHLEMIRSIEVTVMGTFIERELDESTKAVSEVLKGKLDVENDSALKQMRTIYTAQKGKSFSKSNVGKMLKAIFASHKDHPSKVCRIVGTSENGPETIDFVKNDYVFTSVFEYTSRYMPAVEVFETMREGFKKDLPKLERSLGIAPQRQD